VVNQRPESYLLELFDVRDRSVLVTGAASGLGLAFSEALAAAGATVTLADIDEAALQAETGRLRDEGLSVRAYSLDVTNDKAVHAAIQGVASDVGRLDVVFANAGISAGPGPHSDQAGEIENVGRERWDAVLAINLTSVFVTMQAAAAHMKKQGRGRIVVTASTAALEADASVGYAYVAAKAAVANLVRQAALELASFGVLVAGIAPGTFRTNIAGGFVRVPENEAAFARRVPLGRIAEPDEIKGLAVFLASDASSYLTGSTVTIDGGETAGWFSVEGFSSSPQP
jgi:NAD(P)-dependent dehydrogenase (short-subunit alcohol dehydrogenase family)